MLVCFMLGLLTFTPVRMIVGVALAISGVVLMGSSRASTEQLTLSLKRMEGERSEAKTPWNLSTSRTELTDLSALSCQESARALRKPLREASLEGISDVGRRPRARSPDAFGGIIAWRRHGRSNRFAPGERRRSTWE